MVVSVVTEGFTRIQSEYASPQYQEELKPVDAVYVEGKLFRIGTTQGGGKEWLSCTLPPGYDPRPKQDEVEKALYSALKNLVDRQLIKNTRGDHYEEVTKALTAYSLHYYKPRKCGANAALLEACSEALSYIKSITILEHGNPTVGRVWAKLESAINLATKKQ